MKIYITFDANQYSNLIKINLFPNQNQVKKELRKLLELLNLSNLLEEIQFKTAILSSNFILVQWNCKFETNHMRFS